MMEHVYVCFFQDGCGGCSSPTEVFNDIETTLKWLDDNTRTFTAESGIIPAYIEMPVNSNYVPNSY